ncbi:MAG TPA: cytidylate kinase, partial [Planctomycetes bacterium]|nr:cytidylate kinase [Planctomycetota bacterium]
LPDARYKFFLDASHESRVERRIAQNRQAGISGDPAEIAAALARRDAEDRSRDIAPLAPAPDAFYIDTTHLAQQEVVDIIVGIVEADGAANGG